ncbi:MAG: 50S ribosomal protein L9 [Bacteroidetes bacterium]|nr:50S ribosomal protein L9 [Bacteroidota bacterium]
MEVILKQEVENLGSAHEMVTVKPGYARNFLIPRGLAVLATESAKKVHAENVRQRAHKEAKLKENAESLVTRLQSLMLRIGAKAGENGRIFGSVNSIQLSEALAKEGFEIDRKMITLSSDQVKELGEYTAKVKLHRDVFTEVKFEVVAE